MSGLDERFTREDDNRRSVLLVGEIIDHHREVGEIREKFHREIKEVGEQNISWDRTGLMSGLFPP
jgi:hypothetical protein